MRTKEPRLMTGANIKELESHLGSVRGTEDKALAIQAWRPEFNPRTHIKGRCGVNFN